MPTAPLAARLAALRPARPGPLALTALACALAAAPAVAAPAAPPPALMVRGDALWLVDGKGAGREFGRLPAELGAATSLQLDATGKTLLVGSARGWYWAALGGDGGLAALDSDDVDVRLGAWHKLPCGQGRASLAPDGARVLCASVAGTATILHLASGQRLTRNVAVEHAALVGAGERARLVWSDARGVWAAPLLAPATAPAPGKSAAKPPGKSDDAEGFGPAERVAPQAPLRGLSVSPTGARALGVYTGTSRRGKQVTSQELLFGFALDGKAARRKAIAGGQVKAWSADGAWALVQDGAAACIMAAAGGQYKCWKGFRGEALSADGRFALLVGDRGEDAQAEGKARGGKANVEATTAKASKDAKAGKDKKARKDPKTAQSDQDAKAAGQAQQAAVNTPAPLAAPATVPAPAHAATTGVVLPDDLEPSDDDDEGEPSGSASGEGEGEGEEGEDDDGPSAGHVIERHLYRAALEGAFTTAPARLQADSRGPAVFLRR